MFIVYCFTKLKWLVPLKLIYYFILCADFYDNCVFKYQYQRPYSGTTDPISRLRIFRFVTGKGGENSIYPNFQ